MSHTSYEEIRRRRTSGDGWTKRISFKAFSFCGTSTWSPPRTFPPTILESPPPPEIDQDSPSTTEIQETSAGAAVTLAAAAPASSGMNLGAALAAERNSRGPTSTVGPESSDWRKGGGGQVKTLMRLIEETDGVDWRKEEEGAHVDGGDWVCCVCMERSKGAAFIPCGHTFCRACSREVWVNRGSCPICNRSILEILDIF